MRDNFDPYGFTDYDSQAMAEEMRESWLAIFKTFWPVLLAMVVIGVAAIGALGLGLYFLLEAVK